MRSTPGVTIDRAIRGLRFSLWLGAGVDIAVATLLVFAPSVVSRAMQLEAMPFYSAVPAVFLATTGAIGFVVAYAPYGNRRMIRILVLNRLGLGIALLLAPGGPAAATNLLVAVMLVVAAALYLCLRLARL